MIGSGRETLPNVRKTLMDIQEWSFGPPECPGVVKRPSRMSERGRVSVPDVREWSGGLPNVRKALLDIQEWSVGSLGCPGVVGRPSRMSRSGQEAFSDVREF